MSDVYRHILAHATQRFSRVSIHIGRLIKLFVVLLCFSFTVFFTSCHSPLSGDDYVKWVRDYDNGLHAKKQEAGYEFDLQYQPPQYIMLQRAGVAPGQGSGTTLQHYVLSISPSGSAADLVSYGVASHNERQQKLYYFSYEFQQDISLEENGKKLPCALFHYQRSNGITNISTFVLAFETSGIESKEATLVISSGHFSALPVRIRISKDNIPSLAI